jgi:VanZ family protein
MLIDLTIIRARPDRSPERIVLSTGLILALLIGFEEYSQQFFASRTFSLLDLFFSYLGVAVFSWVALLNK